MAAKMMHIIVAALFASATSMKLQGSSDVATPKLTLTNVGSNSQVISEAKAIFVRSEEDHIKSMDEITKGMTFDKAMTAVQHSGLQGASSLESIDDFMHGNGALRGSKGFGGLDGARKLLNDMLHESMEKYDSEIAKCTSYYAQQCALMEVARGQISAANYIAASSRSLILDAQYNINKCEVLIPETKQELKDHNLQCSSQKHALNTRLKAVLNDIAIMTMILEMSDCDAKMLQMDKLVLLRCNDQCTNKKYIRFNHNGLQQKMNSLKSQRSRDLVTSAFSEYFDEEAGTETAESVDFVQVAGSAYLKLVNASEPAPANQFKAVFKKFANKMNGMVNGSDKPMKQVKAFNIAFSKHAANSADEQKPSKNAIPAGDEKGGKNESHATTKFNNPPVPVTKVPSNPCTDPDKGAPSSEDKRAAKCTLKKSPRCYKLQGRFLQIQAAIADDRDQLMEDIQKLDDSCEATRHSLEASITNDQALLESSQTKLATATEKEASAGENARQVNKENEQYNADLMKQMKTCSTNYINFETEICALRKIRGDLFKKMAPGHSGFFQDCEVSKWIGEQCSKVCAGGEQKLTRNVLQHPAGGAKCLPLTAKRRCNLSPCPVDCILESWGGWSKCSAKCGGGVSQRLREVRQAMKYNGKPCGSTSETKACNVAACEKDCVLHEWTRWTKCSKDCDGGTRKRVRMVRAAAEGAGKCAGQWSPDRLQYRPCNMNNCRAPIGKAMKCNKTIDVILLLDGTPKSGKEAWAAEVKSANYLVDAFSGHGMTAKPNFAVIHYTGPRTWSGVSKCTGKSSKKVDMEKVCRVKIAQHFTDKMDEVKNTINGLQYAPGSKLLSLALMTTKAELALGRKTAPTVVIVFIDGEPLSYRKTLMTSREIRKKARLVYVPITKFSPLKNLKNWASRRWQENIVKADTFEEWNDPHVATHVIANICPKEHPKLKPTKKNKHSDSDLQ